MIDQEKCSVLRAAPRLMQILRVLARHKFLGALLGRGHWPPPKEVRESFEELGLVFLKFGQVLAMRRDLLPAAYADELELLHDELPPMGIVEVRATVEAELGAPLTKLFSSFDETPLAAATIAQVHEATMQDGRHVAVNMQADRRSKVVFAAARKSAAGQRRFAKRVQIPMLFCAVAVEGVYGGWLALPGFTGWRDALSVRHALCQSGPLGSFF